MFSRIKLVCSYKLSILILFLGVPLFSFAGGITLDTTRIIYPQESKQITTGVRNTSDKSAFLVQTWVEDANGKKFNNFISTPPLFTSAPLNENTIRLVYAGAPLPKDRETLFYFNVKAIPSINKKDMLDKNALILAAITRVKLFVRPNNLNISPKDAINLINFKKLENKKIQISNNSPYYMTLTNLSSGQQELPSVMVSPFGSTDISTPLGFDTSKLTFSIINDFGGITSPQKAVFN